MDTCPENWPKGYEPVEEIPPVQSERDWLKAQLLDIQEDQAIYSKLKDELKGKDPETDMLLEELQKIQLDIVKIIGGKLIS